MFKLLLIMGAVFAVTVSYTNGSPPTITTLNKTPANFKDGGTLQLHCQATATGSSLITYKWFATDFEGNTKDMSLSRYNLQASTGQLTISNLNHTQDDGFFFCVAMNAEGKVRSKRLLIQVAYLEVFSNGGVYVSTSALQGGNFSFNYPVVKSFPEAIITWTKHGSKLNENERISQSSDTGNLYIGNVDVNDIAYYQSKVWNSVTGQSYDRENISLSVTGRAPSAIPSTPNIILGPTNQVAIKGKTSSVTFECFVSGRPMPVISWWKDGQQISQNSTFSFGSYKKRLTVNNPDNSEAGVYECRATNTTTGESKNRTANLTIIVEPTFIIQPTMVDEFAEESAVFKCNATGIPTPKITWYHNGQNVKPSPTGRIQINNKNELNFTTLQSADKGTVQCVAVNDAGESISKATLNVKAFKIWIDVPPQNTDAIVNETVELQCQGRGDPAPTITWQKNDQNIDFLNNPRYFQTLTGSLRIRKSQKIDSGKYTCVATNSHGSDRANATLRLLFKTVIIKPLPSQIHATKGLPKDLECGVQKDPDISVKWIWNKDGLAVDAARTTLLADGTLRINTVRESDAGSYTCRVESVAGNAASAGTLTVHDQVVPTIRKYQGEPVNIRVTQGGNVTFHCDIQAGNPQPDVTWWFGWTDTNKKVDAIYDARYSHPTEEEWTITGIDTQDVGKYRCWARNVAGEDFLKFEITHVDVPPTIDPLQDYIIANDGENVVLECTVTGTPSPNVEWFYKGSSYKPQTNFTRGNKEGTRITFPKVHVVHTGGYTCRAENGVLDSNGLVIVEKKSMNLYVKSPPKINLDTSPTPVYSFVGNPLLVTIACAFYGYPIPTVVMTDANGTEIARGNGTVSKIINHTTESDFGVYNCSAQSPSGNAQHLVELRKAGKPSKVVNFQAAATCSSVTLTWEPPKDDGGMPINKYVLNYTKNYKDIADVIHVDNTSYTISDLKQNATYNVTLQATNKAERGLASSVEMKTTEYCGSGKPLITNTELEVATDFTVTWSAPQNASDYNNTRYRLEWRKKTINNTTIVGKAENINETRFRIRGLEYDEEYEVKLYAVYREGYSKPDVRTFKTKPKVGKPSKVVDLQAAANCSTITLTWEPPKDDGGMPINRYVLKYTSIYKDMTRDIPMNNNTSYTISDLKQNTTYNITLQATNKYKWGLTSSAEMKTTEYCAPGRPIIYSPSSTLLIKNSFTLKWRRPVETGGDDDITYTVRYRIEKDKTKGPWKTLTTRGLEMEITDLDNQVQYKFEVFAENQGGKGLPDERYIQTNFSAEGSSQVRLVSSVFLTIFVGVMSLLLS